MRSDMHHDGAALAPTDHTLGGAIDHRTASIDAASGWPLGAR